CFFFFSSRRRHTRFSRDWSSDVCSSDLTVLVVENHKLPRISASLTIDNAPYAEGSKAGLSELTGALMGNGTSKISKDAYNEEVRSEERRVGKEWRSRR